MPPPRRILLLRPDAYGDLLLFEPVPRLLKHTWPETEVAVLIREPYADLVPLLDWGDIQILKTDCNPYRDSPGADRVRFAALRETVEAFAPDCLVAACTEQTWLEPMLASVLPKARQISVGQGLTDAFIRASTEAVMPVDWSAIYPEKVLLDPEMPEWEKNLLLVSKMTGQPAEKWWPTARVPEAAREQARQILADRALGEGEYVVCAAAGTANVQIKSWPAAHYGETLAWLEREHGIRALLIGHESEREPLETVREAARALGAEPAVWLGQNGDMPVVGGLLADARFYFGNDTGALHLAAALERSVLPIFGGGHWPRFRPVARRSLCVVQPLPCFGCAWDCYFADAPCVRTISPASMRQALEQFLRDDAEGQTVFEAEGLVPGARALIDAATPRLRFHREDSANRLRQVQRLTLQAESMSRQLQAEDAEHHRQIEVLQSLIRTSEDDRAARLRQTEELAALLTASESDRDARLLQIEELAGQLKASEADRDARHQQIEQLTMWLHESEADRAARGRLLDELAGNATAADEQAGRTI